MARVLRLALVWLLMAALPLHGLAAATRMLGTTVGLLSAAEVGGETLAAEDCAEAHPAATADPAAGDPSDALASVDAATDEDLPAAHDDRGGPGDATRATAARSDPAHAHGAKCGACAACCAVAGAPSVAGVIAPFSLTGHLVAAPSRAHAAPPVRGLERPPRVVLPT